MIVRRVVALVAGLWCAAAHAQKPCPPKVIAEHMLGLFDALDPARRADSVRRLTACRPPGLSGALRSVLATDPDDDVRMAVASGLADLGASEAVCDLERVVEATEHSTALRLAALRALGRMGWIDAAQRALIDTEAPPDLRAEALRVIDAVRPVNPVALEGLARHSTPEVQEVAREILEARRAAAEAAAATAEPPPPPPPPPPERSAEAPPEAPATQPVTPAPAPAATPPPAAPAAEPVVVAPAPVPAPVVPAPALEPLPPVEPVPPATPPTPPPPAGPPKPLDGSWLAITSSSLFGSGLMLQLSLIGEQDSGGVLALTGSAGAVIGGGTAWGISRFYRRPTVGRALWYTNTGAWGVAAGLTIAGSTGTDSTRWKLGGSVMGETAGLALGAWSAHRWAWTPGQVLLADSLALNAALIGSGFQLARGHDPLAPDLMSGVLVVPVLATAAVASRHLDPTARDLHVLGAGATAAGWTGALLGAGFSGEGLDGGRAAGGLMMGLGTGFLSAAASAPFIDPKPRHTWAAASGLVAGEALGGGLALAVDPDRDAGFELGAGLGGVGLGAATIVAWPRLRFGASLADLAAAGALWGAWHGATATVAATEDGTFAGADGRRVGGGALAGTIAGGLTGAVLSCWLDPGPADHATALGGAALGASMGSGLGDLVDPERGNAAGLVAGSAAGLALGATTAHFTRLRGPDVAAGTFGIALGALTGGLGATLGDDDASDTSDRAIHGGLRLGAGAGGLAAVATSRMLDATGAEVGVVSVASVYGAAIGLGAGLSWRGESLRPARTGLVAGPLAMAGLSMALEPKLRLSRGLGPSAPALGAGAAPLGGAYGLLVAAATESEDPSATPGDARPRRLGGGALWGASAASLSGLLLSRKLDPGPADWATAYGGAVFGGALGVGLPRLAADEAGRADTIGLLSGSLGGLALGTATAHVTRKKSRPTRRFVPRRRGAWAAVRSRAPRPGRPPGCCCPMPSPRTRPITRPPGRPPDWAGRSGPACRGWSTPTPAAPTRSARSAVRPVAWRSAPRSRTSRDCASPMRRREWPARRGALSPAASPRRSAARTFTTRPRGGSRAARCWAWVRARSEARRWRTGPARARATSAWRCSEASTA